jgi:hypothetical protein
MVWLSGKLIDLFEVDPCQAAGIFESLLMNARSGILTRRVFYALKKYFLFCLFFKYYRIFTPSNGDRMPPITTLNDFSPLMLDLRETSLYYY